MGISTRPNTAGVWIIVPAFNEAKVIGDVVGDLRSVFANVVCVDDGSRDNTADVALRAGAHVVRHPVNLGQGAAIQTGVEYARNKPGATHFATFDADGQHRVQDVLRMLDRLRRDDLDIVIGTPLRGHHGQPHSAAETIDPSAGGDAEPEQSPTAPHRRVQRVAGVQPHRRRSARSDDERHEPCQRVHQSDRRNHWRVAEEPVEILYTDYSMSKGQPLLNGVNIVFDGFLRGRMR